MKFEKKLIESELERFENENYYTKKFDFKLTNFIRKKN